MPRVMATRRGQTLSTDWGSLECRVPCPKGRRYTRPRHPQSASTHDSRRARRRSRGPGAHYPRRGRLSACSPAMACASPGQAAQNRSPVEAGIGITRLAMGAGTDDSPGRRGGPAVTHPGRWNAADRQPKYLRIHGNLRERITSGQWTPGSPLPSQRELAVEFGVSIMTLRQALQLLTDEGLIETRHGSGTFATAHYAYDLGHLRSFASDLIAQGAEVTTELLAAEAV